MLDANAYPHVMDAIFAGADWASLISLRTVCKEWRLRADLALSDHLVVAHSAEKGVRVTTPGGRHPALREWPAFIQTYTLYASPYVRRLIGAATAIDFVGPVPHRVLAELDIQCPTMRLMPVGDQFPFPDELDFIAQLPDGGPFESVVECTNAHRHHLTQPRFSTLSEVDARRWVSVVTFDARRHPYNRLGAYRNTKGEEYIWILRPATPAPEPGAAQEPGAPRDEYLVNQLAAMMVNSSIHTYASVTPRFKLVGLDSVPREWWCGPWGEQRWDERLAGDEEDGVDGALWDLLRDLVRWWVEKMVSDASQREERYTAVIANTRVLTLEGYRAHLLADPALGARAVELELGDDTLVL